MQQRYVRLVECPRDAMQGWKHLIPTAKKIEYINLLLQAGFDTIDFGSFVSPKAIPQMADTAGVLKGLDTASPGTRLLAIVANERGATEAAQFPAISCLGFPFSISPTFQQRNANSSIGESLERVKSILAICHRHQKQLVLYISMAFGNPYGDAYQPQLVFDWVNELTALGVEVISLADTVGLATPGQVNALLTPLVPAYPSVEIGVHLHSTANGWKEKLDAAIEAGCTRFDGALGGIGGCPMAGDELVGNMDTGLMIPYFSSLGLLPPMNEKILEACSRMAGEIFV